MCDRRLLLAVKSLYSCLEVCVRVGRIKSRPFTVRVGLRQGCVLLLLLVIVYIRGGQITARGPHPANDQFNPTRQIPCTFFSSATFQTGQKCNSINCCLSRKSHGIRPSSGQAVANSALGSKRLATTGLYELDESGNHFWKWNHSPLNWESTDILVRLCVHYAPGKTGEANPAGQNYLKFLLTVRYTSPPAAAAPAPLPDGKAGTKMNELNNIHVI